MLKTSTTQTTQLYTTMTTERSLYDEAQAAFDPCSRLATMNPHELAEELKKTAHLKIETPAKMIGDHVVITKGVSFYAFTTKAWELVVEAYGSAESVIKYSGLWHPKVTFIGTWNESTLHNLRNELEAA